MKAAIGLGVLLAAAPELRGGAGGLGGAPFGTPQLKERARIHSARAPQLKERARIHSARAPQLKERARIHSARAEDACALLSEEEVGTVQGERVQERKPSEASRAFRVVQCFYRTPTFAKSVSVALAVPLPTDIARSGPRAYWRATFHRTRDNPRPVPALGDEAFWVGDRVTGALYVLRGDAFLRLSVGGVADEESRMKRARTLVEDALRRLAGGPRP